MTRSRPAIPPIGRPEHPLGGQEDDTSLIVQSVKGGTPPVGGEDITVASVGGQ
jgi:hypothetical protein